MFCAEGLRVAQEYVESSVVEEPGLFARGRPTRANVVGFSGNRYSEMPSRPTATLFVDDRVGRPRAVHHINARRLYSRFHRMSAE